MLGLGAGAVAREDWRVTAADVKRCANIYPLTRLWTLFFVLFFFCFFLVWWRLACHCCRCQKVCKHIPSHTTLNFYFFLWFDEDRRVTAADVKRSANICPVSTAAQCNTLQHTATPCSTLQHTATHCNTLQHTIHRLDIHLIKKPRQLTYDSPCP